MLQEQDNRCLLCNQPLIPSEAVLDHCHITGYVRGVIHSKCNVLLGKIENFNRRYKHPNLSAFLEGVLEYIGSTTSIFHPSHKTEEEKRALRNKRARRARKNK
jgi:hypothetical protein